MISIIMSTYNENERMLRKAIESILFQTYGDFEYIIIIDNPKNESLCKLVNEYAMNDERIVVSVNSENIGLVKSLNKALGIAKGNYIARMDADDIAFHNRIELQLKQMELGYDIVGTLTSYIDENDEILHRSSRFYSDDKINTMLKFESCVPHPTWLVRKEVYHELNGYRNVDSCEDYDFLLRAVSKRFKIGLTNQELLYYRINSQGISQSKVFKQFITFHYLSRHHKKINSVAEYDIDKYVNANCNEKNKNKFMMAREAFNFGLNKSNGFLYRMKNVLIACTRSRFFIYKMMYLLCSRIYAR